MIRPLRPCKPGCPGWRVARVGAFVTVQRCDACWTGEVLIPTRRYFEKQPECKAAIGAAVKRWFGLSTGC